MYKETNKLSVCISFNIVMGKGSDLSELQKGMIISFRTKGGSISETAKFVNCSRAAVVKVYREWTNSTVMNNRRGNCGTPRAIDVRGERRLRRCVKANRYATVEQLTVQMNRGQPDSCLSQQFSGQSCCVWGSEVDGCLHPC